MHACTALTVTAWTSLAALAEEPHHVGTMAFRAQTISIDGSTIAIEDVNRDGSNDILSAGRRLRVQLGDGTGQWRPQTRYEVGEHPSDLAFADINEDGNIDVVVANHDVHYVTILLGDGRGGFASAPESPLAVDVDPHPHMVGITDIDGDGRVDLLVDHSPRGAPDPGLRRDGGGVLVRRGLDGARFESRGEVMESGGVPYRGFAVGDVSGDGKPDLLTPHEREIGVLLNTSVNGQVSFERTTPIGATAPFTVRLGDLNADGWLDVVVGAGEESDLIEVYLNDQQGGFNMAAGSPVPFARGGKNMVIGDFNGDGVQDAAVSAYRSSELLVILGSAEVLESTRLDGGHEHPWGLAAGDLNGDGVDDLVVAGDGSQRARVYMSINP